ncbi:branched-chain amino acid transport system permease protein [Raineyella antarctica]|uniref:Branched-chain amino acid transport system permease protein n=1 Tax=Raineyella antarctica TaxID=1577474 RepID=A0A1G6HPJ3_9ACTN|nr:branched-chain amino acid ABC transporter permease [Raineyella antarctica]SDB96199.1 branched-chain amino acid transport system permease protein [Raineyella antarctica]
MTLTRTAERDGTTGPTPGTDGSTGQAAASTTTAPPAPSRTPRRWAAVALVVVALVAVAVTPLLVPDEKLRIYSMAGVYAIVAIGLTLQTGRTGQFTMAMPALMGFGAYATAWFGGTLGLPLPVYVLLALIAGLALGAVSGLLSLRLGGDALAITTLGLLMLGQYIFYEAKGFTGGENGVSARGVSTAIGPVDLADLGGLTRPQSMFWLVWGTVLVVAWLGVWAEKHRPGRAMQAIHDSEHAAEAVGIDVRSHKVQVGALGGAAAALGGVLYALLQQFVAPTAWDIPLAMLLFSMIVIGGLGRVSGAVLGAFVIWMLQQFIVDQAQSPLLSAIIKSTDSGPGLISVGAFNLLMSGLTIIVVLLVLPKGLMSLVDRLVAVASSRLRRRPPRQAADS